MTMGRRRETALPGLDPDRSGQTRGRTRRAAERTWKAWRDTGKVADADTLAQSLLYRSADLLDEVCSPLADESAYTRAFVLGRAVDVARFVTDRVAGDADGPTLADLLAGMVDAEDAGPPD